ncbi:hypothetical protein CMK11_09580 [Candidatus Poribacteria bacterium]|nr:hypothetical protein [Candidatus Poribacteria bacterium]
MQALPHAPSRLGASCLGHFIAGGFAMGQWVALLAAAVVVGLFFVALVRDVRRRHAEPGE